MTQLKSGENNKYIGPLIELGLHEHEARVYITLLSSRAPLGGTQISKRADMPRQYVYNSIPKLVERGLVIEVKYGSIHKYKAESVSKIEALGRKQAVLASEASRMLSEISAQGSEQDFEIIKGESQIQKFELARVKSGYGKYEYIIGGASEKFLLLMDNMLEQYLKEKNTNKHIVKYLGTESERESYKKYIGKYPDQEYRFSKSLPSGVAHMVITEDTVSFYTFVNPPLLYIIYSKEVADNYKKFFEMLWETGK